MDSKEIDKLLREKLVEFNKGEFSEIEEVDEENLVSRLCSIRSVDKSFQPVPQPEKEKIASELELCPNPALFSSDNLSEKDFVASTSINQPRISPVQNSSLFQSRLLLSQSLEVDTKSTASRPKYNLDKSLSSRGSKTSKANKGLCSLNNDIRSKLFKKMHITMNANHNRSVSPTIARRRNFLKKPIP